MSGFGLIVMPRRGRIAHTRDYGEAIMAEVSAAHQVSEHEEFSVAIEIENDYPDALRQATNEAVRAVRDMLTNAVQIEREASNDG